MISTEAAVSGRLGGDLAGTAMSRQAKSQGHEAAARAVLDSLNRRIPALLR